MHSSGGGGMFAYLQSRSGWKMIIWDDNGTQRIITGNLRGRPLVRTLGYAFSWKSMSLGYAYWVKRIEELIALEQFLSVEEINIIEEEYLLAKIGWRSECLIHDLISTAQQFCPACP